MSRAEVLAFVLAAAVAGSACTATNAGPTPKPCDDAIHPVAAPAGLSAIGHDQAVGSGDTWFIPPTTGTFSPEVHWDGKQYFMKIGIWTSMAQPPMVTVSRTDGRASGSASFGPTSAGLPGPLPTSLMFTSVGCWNVDAQGVTGRATAVIRVSTSIPTDRPR